MTQVATAFKANPKDAWRSSGSAVHRVLLLIASLRGEPGTAVAQGDDRYADPILQAALTECPLPSVLFGFRAGPGLSQAVCLEPRPSAALRKTFPSRLSARRRWTK